MDINIQRKMPDNYTVIAAPTNKFDVVRNVVGNICYTATVLGIVGVVGYYIFRVTGGSHNGSKEET